MSMFSDFIQYLQSEKRSSRHTVTAYKTDLNQFLTYLQKTYQVDCSKDVSEQMVRSWIVSLADQRVSSRSINRKLSSVKALFRFEQKNNWLKRNPAASLKGPKVKKRLPEYVAETEIEDLFEKIPFPSDFKGQRDKLILSLFYHTGIRLSELRNLRDTDVHIQHRTIRVMGKRNKERMIPIHTRLMDQIQSYQEVRNASGFAPSPYLIRSNSGQQTNTKFVYRCVNGYLSKATNQSKKSPHILRHTFATHMLNNGADLHTIKELLGHANLAATQIYTHTTLSTLKEVYKQAHPKGQ